MGLFKKKPGGTFFGNLLRAGSNKVSGGVLGTGANRIEIGQTQTNAELAASQGVDFNANQERFINDIIPPDQTKQMHWVIGGLVALIIGMLAYTQGLFDTGKKSKKWKVRK